MDFKPVVSIIMPAYNASLFLAETVKSVIGQSFKDWELLIIDDYSSDKTFEIAQEFAQKDQRVKVSRMPFNSGRPAVPRNYGIRNAKGKYIAFLDSDDLWFPEKLQKQVDFLERNPDIFMCFSQCMFRDSGKDTYPRKIFNIAEAGNFYRRLFLSDNFIICLTVMMRNEYGNHRYFFNESKKLCAIEDFDLWLSIAHKERVGYLRMPLGIYVSHSSNISRNLRKFLLRYNNLIIKHKNNLPFYLLMIKYALLFRFFVKLTLSRLIKNRGSKAAYQGVK